MQEISRLGEKCRLGQSINSPCFFIITGLHCNSWCFGDCQNRIVTEADLFEYISPLSVMDITQDSDS